MTESELYKELGMLTKDKGRWQESIPYVSSLLNLLVDMFHPLDSLGSVCQYITVRKRYTISADENAGHGFLADRL